MGIPSADDLLSFGKIAKKKLYHSMLSRIKNGETLTPSELKTFQALEKILADDATPDTEPQATTATGIYLNTMETAAFFGVTPRTLQNWAIAGCPQDGRGRWNLKAVYDWWWENIAQERAAAESSDESMSEAKRQYWWEKLKAEQSRNSQIRGELVGWPVIEQEWAGRVSLVTAGLEAFKDRLPPLLVGRSRLEMRGIIAQEVRTLREAYARKGKYCPKG